MGALLPLAQLTESGLPRAKKRCLATVSIPFLQAPASLLLHNCRLCGVVLRTLFHVRTSVIPFPRPGSITSDC